MRGLTETRKKRLWEEVQHGFPGDATMQHVHYVRLIHHIQTEGLSSSEKLRFLSDAKAKRQPKAAEK